MPAGGCARIKPWIKYAGIVAVFRRGSVVYCASTGARRLQSTGRGYGRLCKFCSIATGNLVQIAGDQKLAAYSVHGHRTGEPGEPSCSPCRLLRILEHYHKLLIPLLTLSCTLASPGFNLQRRYGDIYQLRSKPDHLATPRHYCSHQ